MGRHRRPPAKRADLDSDEADKSNSVIILSSSDDEEANKDLSLELLERAKERESRRKRAAESELIVLSSASSEDIVMNFDRSAFEDEEEVKGRKMKSKGKNRKKKEGKAAAAASGEEKAVDGVPAEEPVGTADSVITEVNEVPDNAVLRKLLRGPRYFDPVARNSDACFNCGEEGHAAVNCTVEKRKKPCFVCGMFGHNAKHCTQGQDCFICKRRGHIAKNCPDRNKRTPRDSIICLRCGDLGHDMLSCKNDYAANDLKEIQCYICKNYGHLCCVDFMDDCPREASCYNCAQSGHTGIGCAKPRGEMTDVASPDVCYKCGEEGHFARGCTKNAKFDRWGAESSTPWRLADGNRYSFDGNRDSLGFRSVPNDFDMARKKKKKKKFQYEDMFEDRWNTTSGKSRKRGGWIVDDPGDSSRRLRKKVWRSWNSTPTRKRDKVYSTFSVGHYSTPQPPFKRRKPFSGTPYSDASTSSNRHSYSTPRYYGRSQGHCERM